MIDVLLVEPDKVLAKTYKGALQSAGYSVAHQTQAQAAVHSVDKQRPAVVILELQLAEHGGVEFLYELRSYQDWQDIPVIILSMVPPAEAGLDEQIMNSLGIAAYHYKPQTSLQKLVDSVKELTGG